MGRPALLSMLLLVSAKALSHEHLDVSFGVPGDPEGVSKTIEIKMSDVMRFEPSRILVKRGETIRFLLTNVGKVKHEMVIDTPQELREHAELMKRFPDMEHSDPNHRTVQPGETGAIIWRFTKSGTFPFACLQAGHFDAGMRGTIVVR